MSVLKRHAAARVLGVYKNTGRTRETDKSSFTENKLDNTTKVTARAQPMNTESKAKYALKPSLIDDCLRTFTS